LNEIEYEIINLFGDRIPITSIKELDPNLELDKIPSDFYLFKHNLIPIDKYKYYAS